MRAARRALFTALLLHLTLIPAARAQSTSGTITGVVRSRDGSPVPGAIVSARSPATGVTRSALTNAAGQYRIDLLSPGEWTVDVHLGEALACDPRTVELHLQQTLSVDLEIGEALSESVVVSAEPPVVDPSRTQGEMRIASDVIDALPLNGRTFTDLAMIDGSVLPSPPGDFYGERGAVLVANGQSGRGNSFLIDGLDNNDLTSGTSLNAFFSQQVIKEFVVMTHQFAPEFGRAAGGILNVITRQGSNDFAASAFVQGVSRQVNDPGAFIDSLPATEGVDDTSSRLETGLTLSGPLRRDKAFGFFAYEHQKEDSVVPFTGVGRDGIPGGFVVAPQGDDNLFFRTDVNLSATQFLMLRLSGDHRTSEGLNVGGTNTPESGFGLDEKDLQLATSLNSILSPTLLNEARVFIGTSGLDQSANSSRPGVDRPSGTFGGNNLNLQERNEDRVQMVDNLTWTKGPHTMKFGVDVIRSRTHIRTRFNPNGNFLYETDAPFEPGDCGDLNASDVKNYGDNPIPCPGVVGVDDDGDGRVDEPGLIRTYPLYFQLIDGEPQADLWDTRLAWFAQDTWHAGTRLVLDYGLRYDLSTFRLPESTAVPSFIPNGGADRDTDNFAPRLGFAFTPHVNGRAVIRGGAGLFYDKLVLGFPAVAAITSGTKIGLFFPQGEALEITEDVVEEVGIDAIREGLQFPPELTLRFSTGTRLDTPYTVQYNLGAEWAVGKSGSFEVNATRVLGYHQALLRDLNPPTGELNGQGAPIHPDTTTGSIAAIVTEGRSWYNGLSLGYRWRGKGSWYSASYVLSRAEDYGPDPLKGGISLPPHSDNIPGERGLSDADRRHRLVLTMDTPLPWLGLRASGVVQLATAAPFNVTTGGDENLDGITTDRPTGVRRNTGADTPLEPINETRDKANVLREQVDLAPLPALTSIPSAPNFAQIDLRISRAFNWGDHKSGGEFYLQVFNVLDRYNGGPIEGRAISPDFGKPIGQLGPPRTLEGGLKLSF